MHIIFTPDIIFHLSVFASLILFTLFRAQSGKLFYANTVGIVTTQAGKDGNALNLNLKNSQLTKI